MEWMSWWKRSRNGGIAASGNPGGDMTIDDRDRAGRTQMTLRIERDLLQAIDALAAERQIERTELARRLLTDGVARERLEGAVAAYAAGRTSMWDAASEADVTLYEMIDRVADAGVPYRIDPEVLDRKRRTGGRASTPMGGASVPGATSIRGDLEPTHHETDENGGAMDAAATIKARRDGYRPDRVRLLFVGESSPAGGTHFYLANSNLYRATRDGLAQGLSVGQAPTGDAFLAWFKALGCWLVDLAHEPVNRLPGAERKRLVRTGIPGLAETLRTIEPDRVVVVVSSIAADVREAAKAARFDERSIDVLPFPTRQWTAAYIEQLAGIARDVLGRSPVDTSARVAVAEPEVDYGSALIHLHDAIAVVLRRHPGEWMRSSSISREIAAADLWRRPSDSEHPPASQVSARARKYPNLFQTSDLGIRLRRS
jgi:hypothetical protein